jgi:NAD-dependent dihydropyrimidine dehydrogenase PreA subunit
MKRAQLNFAVDAVIAAAFLITAVTGILFLLPSGAVRELGIGRPGMLGVSYATWRHLHDWSGVVAVAGVLVHAALHYRWIVNMTRRTFAPAPVASRPAARARLTADARADAGASANGGAERPAVAAPAQSRADGRGATGALRSTRRGFVLGAAAGLGAVLLGGGLLGRLGAFTAGDTAIGATGNAATGTTGTGGSTSATGTGGATATGTSAGVASGQTAGPTPVSTPGSAAATAVLVAVDESSCIGCGRCLEVCPADVFSWDQGGRRSVAERPGQCVHCRRCVGVCPVNAITLAA